MPHFSVGAEVTGEHCSFRVWAPGCGHVAVTVEGRETLMAGEPGGYFSATAAARQGERYGYRLDDEERLYPDPASRYQPDGPHGLSQIVDRAGYEWAHERWPATPLRRQVIYELHIGTFSVEGTWAGASRHLARLREIGVTTIEVMPIAEFPGAFGWGYDGVQWFAPYHGYGTPDDLRRFVDTAHGLGLGVILDVVYNHLGPDGNYLHRFAPSFVATAHATDWGEALNFDGEQSEGMRALVVANARYWIEEFRLDGLRLDALQQIFDDSSETIVAELTREARAAAGDRPITIVGEHEPQHARLIREPSAGGAGLDGLWNDDFHHAAVVALTGDTSAYYGDYEGSAREMLSCVRHGFLFQGQRYAWQKSTRGEPALDIASEHFICYLENHDQVANSANGARLHRRAAAGCLRAMTALLLMGPWTPMLFQGQEFGSSKPFLFFADHKPGLAEQVAAGRRAFGLQFPRMRDAEIDAALDPPHDPRTFSRSVLDDREREEHVESIALHRDLLRLRRDDATLSAEGRAIHGSALNDVRLLLRFEAPGAPARLLVVNLGQPFDLATVSDPLVVPSPAGWRLVWHSERPAYGGAGMPPLEDERWEMPSHAAVLLGEA